MERHLSQIAANAAEMLKYVTGAKNGIYSQGAAVYHNGIQLGYFNQKTREFEWHDILDYKFPGVKKEKLRVHEF